MSLLMPDMVWSLIFVSPKLVGQISAQRRTNMLNEEIKRNITVTELLI